LYQFCCIQVRSFAFDVDEAAMTGAVDFHDTAPFASPAARSIAAISASEKPTSGRSG
jgi:hypothetical protein